MGAHPAGSGLPGGSAPLNGIKYSIAVASGKGGVGKSTVSVNLAVALAQAGAATGLLDADLYGPSIPLMTGINRMPQSNGQKILPLTAHGIRLMSLGFLMPDGAPVIWRGPMVSGAIRQFLQDVEWGALDYLLIDLPPGTGDAQLTLAQSLPLAGAVIVMTPQDLAMHIASKALAMFQQLLGEIPLDPSVCQTSDRGEPIVTSHPDSAVADAFRRVSGALAGRLQEEALSAPVIRIGE